MGFFLCNKRKIAVKPTINQNLKLSQKHYWENFKNTNYKYRFSFLIIIIFADVGYLVRLPEPATPVGPGGHTPPPTFLHSKNKKWKQRKKRKSFKAESIERLSPRLKCYCFSLSRVSRIQIFSCCPIMVADNTFHCSMAPPL